MDISTTPSVGTPREIVIHPQFGEWQIWTARPFFTGIRSWIGACPRLALGCVVIYALLNLAQSVVRESTISEGWRMLGIMTISVVIGMVGLGFAVLPRPKNTDVSLETAQRETKPRSRSGSSRAIGSTQARHGRRKPHRSNSARAGGVREPCEDRTQSRPGDDSSA